MSIMREKAEGIDMPPRISIIIPTYNCAQYIIEALESVFQQDYSLYEVIVVDDGSTDNTRQVLKPYFNKIRYVYQENAGSAVARNHGLRLACGEFIGFLDADDFFLPGKLTEQMAIFEQEPMVDAVYSGKRIVKQNRGWVSDIEPWQWCTPLNLKNILLYLPIYLGALIVRRVWVEQIDGFDSQFRQSEDADFFLQLALTGCQFVWLPKVTVAYRLHQTNITDDGLMALKCKKAVLKKFFSQPEVPDDIRALKHQAWTQALLWQIWRLFYTECFDDIVPALRELRSWSSDPLQIETILFWIVNFHNWHLSYGGNPEEIRSLWPYIFQVVSYDSELCERIERVLDWKLSQKTENGQTFYDLPLLWKFIEHLEVDLSLHLPLEMVLEFKDGEIGRGYFQGHYESHLLEKLSVVRQIPRKDVVRFLQYLISTSHHLITVPHLRQLCHDLQTAEIVSCSETYLFTPLYLTVFGQAMFVHHAWGVALKGLYEALKVGRVRPYAIKAWGRFFSNAFTHWFRRKEK